MARIENQTFEETYNVPLEEAIREPDICMETKAYLVGEQAYAVLKQNSVADLLSPLAFGSLGIALTQAYSLLTYLCQIYRNIGDTETVAQLKESKGDEIDNAIIMLILSIIVFVILLLINHFVPTKKKKLFKEMRELLDDNPSIIARNHKGE